jgi:FkbM family methyltransferase
MDTSHVERLLELQHDLGRSRIKSLWALARRGRRQLLSATMAEFLPKASRTNVERIIDVGGHHGDWTAGMQSLYPGVIATIFEPTPASAARLRDRFRSDNVSVIEAALGSSEGTVDFFHVGGLDALNSLHRPSGISLAVKGAVNAGMITYPVNLTTLDAAIADPRIDVMKVDVQGAEAEVFEGGREVLRRTACVVVETPFSPQYEGGSIFTDVQPLLEQAGLAFHRFTHLHYGQQGTLLWTDAVFVRPEAAP